MNSKIQWQSYATKGVPWRALLSIFTWLYGVRLTISSCTVCMRQHRVFHLITEWIATNSTLMTWTLCNFRESSSTILLPPEFQTMINWTKLCCSAFHSPHLYCHSRPRINHHSRSGALLEPYPIVSGVSMSARARFRHNQSMLAMENFLPRAEMNISYDILVYAWSAPSCDSRAICAFSPMVCSVGERNNRDRIQTYHESGNIGES